MSNKFAIEGFKLKVVIRNSFWAFSAKNNLQVTWGSNRFP